MGKIPEILHGAIRQYRSNFSDSIVTGFDIDEVLKVIKPFIKTPCVYCKTETENEVCPECRKREKEWEEFEKDDELEFSLKIWYKGFKYNEMLQPDSYKKPYILNQQGATICKRIKTVRCIALKDANKWLGKKVWGIFHPFKNHSYGNLNSILTWKKSPMFKLVFNYKYITSEDPTGCIIEDENGKVIFDPRND